MTLANLQIQTGTQLVFQNDSWQLNASTFPSGSINLTPLTLLNCPSPGVMGALMIASSCAHARRRRR
jgi:hypothetical protein